MPNVRKPTAVREIQGNPSNRPMPVEPEIKGSIKMPRTLTPAAKIVWKNVTGAMVKGVFKPTDTYILAAYCEQVAAHDEAVAKIAQNGSVSVGSQGQEIVSPWVRIRNEAASKVVTLGAKLGLSPADRQSIPSGETQSYNKFMH